MRNHQPGVLSLRAPALDVGARVPEILLEDSRGRTLTLSSLRGQSVVVAFSPRWSAAQAPRVDDELRAELRGLGTVLLAVAADGIWLHQADDPVEHYSLATASGASLEALHHAFGIATFAVALFVIDPRGAVRWRSYGAGLTSDEVPAVLGALRAAAVALRAPPPAQPLALSRRELVISAIVAAFAAVALGGCQENADRPAAPGKPAADSGTVAVRLEVNGTFQVLQIEPPSSFQSPRSPTRSSSAAPSRTAASSASIRAPR